MPTTVAATITQQGFNALARALTQPMLTPTFLGIRILNASETLIAAQTADFSAVPSSDPSDPFVNVNGETIFPSSVVTSPVVWAELFGPDGEIYARAEFNPPLPSGEALVLRSLNLFAPAEGGFMVSQNWGGYIWAPVTFLNAGTVMWPVRRVDEGGNAGLQNPEDEGCAPHVRVQQANSGLKIDMPMGAFADELRPLLDIPEPTPPPSNENWVESSRTTSSSTVNGVTIERLESVVFITPSGRQVRLQFNHPPIS